MKLVYYTMPYSELAQGQLSKFINFCKDRGFEYRIVDLKDIVKPQELMDLRLHGIPTIRRDDDEYRELVGKFNKTDLETLCADNALLAQ